jgi:hypothetical protein
VGVARTCIIEIGRELIAAKAAVPHGGWLPWLAEEFEWTDETARKYMRVAQAFQIPTKLGFDGLTIDATALYALSAPDVPLDGRDLLPGDDPIRHLVKGRDEGKAGKASKEYIPPAGHITGQTEGYC